MSGASHAAALPNVSGWRRSRLNAPQPAVLNPSSKRSVSGYVEPGLADVAPGERFQFERHGYFIADPIDHQPGRRVFNRTATLKDTWQA